MIEEIAAALPGFQDIGGQKVFILRDGVRFGMSPQEVIRAEDACGYEYRERELYFTDDGLLFDAGVNYQLNYDVKTEKLGSLPLFRFEYDFNRKKKRLYQFYYVFGENRYVWQDSTPLYLPLSLALQSRYGAAVTGTDIRSQRFSQDWPDHTRAYSQWILRDGETRIIVDLWESIYDIVFLAFQEKGSVTRKRGTP